MTRASYPPHAADFLTTSVRSDVLSSLTLAHSRPRSYDPRLRFRFAAELLTQFGRSDSCTGWTSCPPHVAAPILHCYARTSVSALSVALLKAAWPSGHRGSLPLSAELRNAILAFSGSNNLRARGLTTAAVAFATPRIAKQSSRPALTLFGPLPSRVAAPPTSERLDTRPRYQSARGLK